MRHVYSIEENRKIWFKVRLTFNTQPFRGMGRERLLALDKTWQKDDNLRTAATFDLELSGYHICFQNENFFSHPIRVIHLIWGSLIHSSSAIWVNFQLRWLPQWHRKFYSFRRLGISSYREAPLRRDLLSTRNRAVLRWTPNRWLHWYSLMISSSSPCIFHI